MITMLKEIKNLRTKHHYTLWRSNGLQKETGLETEETQSLLQIPGFLVLLLLLHEDDLFFAHRGFNLREIKNRLKEKFFQGVPLAGGSSLTQQLAKNVFLLPQKTWRRKLNEALYTLIIEKQLSKEEILALYLHNIRMTKEGTMSGLIAAASYFFAKQVTELNFVEGLFLFGMIPNPTVFHTEAITKQRSIFFRYKNSYGQLMNYFRLVYRSFGPLALNQPELISYNAAIDVMKQYKSFRHDQFSKDEQAAFEVRAALVIHDLHSLIKQLGNQTIGNEVIAAYGT